MISHRHLCAIIGFALLLAARAAFPAEAENSKTDPKQRARDQQFFETKIRPVLVKRCYKCHAADSDEVGGGLLLDSREASIKGGETGPAVVPGNIKKSLLISAIEYRDFEMPPDAKLPNDTIRDFRKWIASGAIDPRDGKAPTKPETAEPKASAELWSLKPVGNPNVPKLGSGWARSDVDRFVLAKLHEQNLKPVSDADLDALLRRTTIDLIGLPPTLEVQHTFREAARDDLPEAMQLLVDELLASPQFGERWGRHWMDAVRYAESAGNSRDVLMPWAWRYRDYIIDAFNADVPFDRFVTEQIAGDLLKADSSAERDRLRIATGFLAVGSKSLNGGNLELDVPDDQIDVIGKAILGLTISCARCHDHKFDPIPTADYYSLVGIFRSTETLYGGGTRRPKSVTDRLKVYVPLGEDVEARVEQVQKTAKQVASLTKKQATAAKRVAQLQKRLPKDWQTKKTELEKRKAAANGKIESEGDEPNPLTAQEKKLLTQFAQFESARKQQQKLQAEIKELKSSSLPEIAFAIGVRDKSKVNDSPIYLRGEKNKPGKVTPRGFLSAVSLGEDIGVNKSQSGRLELARWLTHPDHPLTSRVIVNRVWQHLFGRGLVETVDNFGINGTQPSHRKLLDWLAHRFVHKHRWSLKSLIRELVLTRTYGLASSFDEANFQTDPGNVFLWRMARRRLEAEPIRDSILAASGQLDLERPLGSAVMKMGEGEVGRGIKTEYLAEPFAHRTVYLPILRTKMPAFLKTFDYPEPSNPQGLRDATNVPAQSLFLMNSPFVLEQSAHLAKRVLGEETEQTERLEMLWRLTLSRSPSGSEIARSLEFLSRADDKLKAEQSDQAQRQITTWTMLGQALFASAEFRYLN